MHAGRRRRRRTPEGRELMARDEPPLPYAAVGRAMQVIAARAAARRSHGRRGPRLRPGLSSISVSRGWKLLGPGLGESR